MNQPTVVEAAWPNAPGRLGTLGRGAFWAACGSVLIALAAQVRVPIGPVPLTLQTLAVLVVGMMLGARRGVAAAGLYLAEGVCGLPVFASGLVGPAALAGPTGGYLLAFPAAAWLAGRLAQRGWDRSYLRAAAGLVVADAAILLCGWAWLAASLGPRTAFVVGVAPFLLFNALKIAGAAALLPMCWGLVGRRRG